MGREYLALWWGMPGVFPTIGKIHARYESVFSKIKFLNFCEYWPGK
jgi:hypothetical protein